MKEFVMKMLKDLGELEEEKRKSRMKSVKSLDMATMVFQSSAFSAWKLQQEDSD